MLAHLSNRSFSDTSRAVARAAIRLPSRTREEDGFTVVELLVVILIIGILAAIAIPSFISQTKKANDSAAKVQIGTLATTMRAFATENSGSYAGATLVKLEAIEPTLKDKTTAIAKEVVNPTSTGFEVESDAVGSNDVYKLTSADGEVTRSCTPANAGGCKKGSW